MHCPEFRDVMRSFLDGEVDGRTRRDIGRHLVECQDCAKLIEDDRFWNETLRTYLDHELPAGLREDILGDLVHVEVAAEMDHAAADATSTARVRDRAKVAPTGRDLDNLTWREQLRIAWWAIRRDLRHPKGMLQAAAVAVVVILALNYLPWFRSQDDSTDPGAAFGQAGPIVQMGQEVQWQPGETVPTARLSLSGRLI